MKILWFVLLAVVFIGEAWSDTITFRDDSEINGKVEYAKGIFSIEVRYPGGTRTLRFAKSEVQ